MIRVSKILENHSLSEFKNMATCDDAISTGVGDVSAGSYVVIPENTHRYGNLLIFYRQDIIGYSQYIVNAQQVVSFSLYIKPEYRGKHYATLCFERLNEYVFENLDVFSIRHTCFLYNQKMIHLLNKIGCELVGILRQGGITLNEFNEKISHPCVIFEYTKLDYENKKNNKNENSPLKSYGIDDPNFLKKEINRLKTQAMFKSEVETLLSDALKGNNHHRVLDIGCGIGNITSNLAAKFPENQFTGIDLSSDFIQAAKINFERSNCDYISGDILENDLLIQENDIFIMRFVSQHMGQNGTAKVLKKVKEIKKHNFKIIISDVDDRSWVFEPPCLAYELAFRGSAISQKKYGGDRYIGSKIPNLAESLNLTVEKFELAKIDSISIGIENFEKIIDPLLYDKVDLNYIGKNSMAIIKNEIIEYRKKQRFGLGCVYCYTLRG
ncbi:MAG: GNAT family N-acetyltransferase [Pseudobdellovibrio sp.]